MMSFIIWCIIIVGVYVLTHDAMMLGFFGRIAQNYAFNGKVHDQYNREVLVQLVEVSNSPENYRVVEFSNINTMGDKQEFLSIQDSQVNRYGEYNEHMLFDVTGTPTTNPMYGERYDRWSTSSKVVELMIGGDFNLSINTKDRLRELHLSLKEPSHKEDKNNFQIFKKKVVHLS